MVLLVRLTAQKTTSLKRWKIIYASQGGTTFLCFLCFGTEHCSTLILTQTQVSIFVLQRSIYDFWGCKKITSWDPFFRAEIKMKTRNNRSLRLRVYSSVTVKKLSKKISAALGLRKSGPPKKCLIFLDLARSTCDAYVECKNVKMYSMIMVFFDLL